MRLVLAFPEPERFLAPGRVTIEVAAPGTHVIWHEHRTVFEGRAYDAPAQLPAGARIRVAAPGGREVRTEPGSGSWKSGSVERQAAAEFRAEAPGRYAVSVEGEFGPRVLAVGPSFLGPLLKTIGGAIAAAVIGVGAGIAVGLYAFLRHVEVSRDSETTPQKPERERRLRQLVAVVYGLQAVSLLVGVTLIAGVIVNYLKRREAEGTWLESHFRWQIRTFWWTLLWGVLGLASAIVLVGFLVLLGATAWFIYRIAKGWTALDDGQPMYREATSPPP